MASAAARYSSVTPSRLGQYNGVNGISVNGGLRYSFQPAEPHRINQSLGVNRGFFSYAKSANGMCLIIEQLSVEN